MLYLPAITINEKLEAADRNHETTVGAIKEMYAKHMAYMDRELEHEIDALERQYEHRKSLVEAAYIDNVNAVWDEYHETYLELGVNLDE